MAAAKLVVGQLVRVYEGKRGVGSYWTGVLWSRSPNGWWVLPDTTRRPGAGKLVVGATDVPTRLIEPAHTTAHGVHR